MHNSFIECIIFGILFFQFPKIVIQLIFIYLTNGFFFLKIFQKSFLPHIVVLGYLLSSVHQFQHDIWHIPVTILDSFVSHFYKTQSLYWIAWVKPIF